MDFYLKSFEIFSVWSLFVYWKTKCNQTWNTLKENGDFKIVVLVIVT